MNAYKFTKIVYSLAGASDDSSDQWKTVQTIQFNCPLFRYQATVPLEITLINKYEYQNQY